MLLRPPWPEDAAMIAASVTQAVARMTGSLPWPYGRDDAAAWLAAVIFAFVTNKLWVFESRDMSPGVVAGEAAKFFGSRIFTGIIETVCPSLLVMAGLDTSLFGAQGGVAKLTVSILIIILNYILSKLLVFRKKDRQADKGTDKQEE